MIRARYGRAYFSLIVVPILFAPGLLHPSEKSRGAVGISANELANKVVQNELNAQQRSRSLWKYREEDNKDGKKTVFEVVQTRAGEVRRLVAVNDEPLDSKERAAENRRIQKLLKNRDEWREKQKDRDEDTERERKLLAMLPSAFLYEFDGKQRGLIRLRFTPNPNFHPNNRESEVFHHMEGVFLVDPKQERLAELDGRLLTEIKFGGGLLGRLNAGGIFSVKQTDLGAGHWEMTSLDVKMDGKALLFKTIAVREKQVCTNFEEVPDNLSLEQAAQLLQSETAELKFPVSGAQFFITKFSLSAAGFPD